MLARFFYATLLILFFFNFQLLAQPAQRAIEPLLAEAHVYEVQRNEKAAYDKYKEVLRAAPRNVQALVKCSELCSRIGKRETTEQKRDDYYKAAKTYADIALSIAPNHSEANCVMAIALGRISLNHSGKEKVNAAKDIRKYVDKALLYDANNYKAWHVLGRWHFELSSLNVIERTAVKVFFGKIPHASFKDAIVALEKANDLSKGFILNYFELARAYKKAGQKAKAIATIKQMLQLPDTTEDDAATKADGEALLKEWGN
jgi:tetratricopeptide (TPR) repeat protein